MTERLIETMDDVAEGADWLAAREPRFAHALETTGLPPLRRNPDGFPGLLRIVVGQQVSVAAADGIWRRIEQAGAADLAGLSTCPDGLLQACGLSEAKRRSARAIAESGLDFTALAAMPEAEAKAALCALRGVGPWTAEVYLMFCVGRADVFAPGDLALQEGARSLFGLGERPAPKALAAMAGPWSPWRAVAARMLWAWYAHVKGREGVSQ